MSIEQTDQLIQLILNSVVMVAASIFLLGGLLRRYSGVSDRLQQTQHQYAELMSELMGNWEESRNGRVAHLKTQLHRLRQRHRLTHYSVLAVHYALLFLIASTFLLALRTVLQLDKLIMVALVLFIVGVGILLLGVGLTLYELQTSGRSFWRETRGVLNRPEGKPVMPKPTAPQRVLAAKTLSVEQAEEQRSPDTRVS